jgi:hypothetical protein
MVKSLTPEIEVLGVDEYDFVGHVFVSGKKLMLSCAGAGTSGSRRELCQS